MAASPAYRYTERAPQRAPHIEVVPGRRRASDVDSLPSSVMLLAKICAVFLVVFALLGFARIGLASATVTTAVETENVLAKIEGVRSEGNELEVRESYLSNPTYVKAEATALGMEESTGSASLTLPQDVVITDAEGNLSLSGSLQAASQG